MSRFPRGATFTVGCLIALLAQAQAFGVIGVRAGQQKSKARATNAVNLKEGTGVFSLAVPAGFKLVPNKSKTGERYEFVSPKGESISVAVDSGDPKEMQAFFDSSIEDIRKRDHLDWSSGGGKAVYEARKVTVAAYGNHRSEASTIGVAWILVSGLKSHIYGIRFRSKRDPRLVLTDLGILCKSFKTR